MYISSCHKSIQNMEKRYYMPKRNEVPVRIPSIFFMLYKKNPPNYDWLAMQCSLPPGDTTQYILYVFRRQEKLWAVNKWKKKRLGMVYTWVEGLFEVLFSLVVIISPQNEIWRCETESSLFYLNAFFFFILHGVMFIEHIGLLRACILFGDSQ